MHFSHSMQHLICLFSGSIVSKLLINFILISTTLSISCNYFYFYNLHISPHLSTSISRDLFRSEFLYPNFLMRSKHTVLFPRFVFLCLCCLQFFSDQIIVILLLSFIFFILYFIKTANRYCLDHFCLFIYTFFLLLIIIKINVLALKTQLLFFIAKFVYIGRVSNHIS